ALLGLLRALETARPRWFPRAAWDLDKPPLRPVLTIAEQASAAAVCATAADGIAKLVAAVDFVPAADLKLAAAGARSLCDAVSRGSDDPGRYFAELSAALISDAARDQEQARVEPTPLAYPSVATSNFLKNFIALCKAELPEKRGRDATYPKD